MIYIITSSFIQPLNLYKIGASRSVDSLSILDRYRTQLCQPKLIAVFPRENPFDCEAEIHKKLEEFRLPNDRGNPSEWFKCDALKILDAAINVPDIPMEIESEETNDDDESEAEAICSYDNLISKLNGLLEQRKGCAINISKIYRAIYGPNSPMDKRKKLAIISAIAKLYPDAEYKRNNTGVGYYGLAIKPSDEPQCELELKL